MSESAPRNASDALAEAELVPIRTAGLYFPVLNARGGAERLTLVMALELAKAGIETTIFASRTASVAEIEDDLGESIESITIEMLPAPMKASRRRAVQQLIIDRVEAAAIRARRPDLFINCDYHSTLPGCGRLNVFYCHFPHELHIQEMHLARRAYLGAIELAKRAFVDRNIRGSIDTYQQIWANSRFTADNVKVMWARSADVVYPPCDMLMPLAKERRIVAVGRFQSGRGPGVPHKSQGYLVDAFRRLTDLHAEGWRLQLVGAASAIDEPFVTALREQSAGLPIDITVNASRRDVTDALGAASIFWHAQGVEGDASAHPRSQEHFGISTVEAMSAGVLPLVYGDAGPAEIVGNFAAFAPWSSLVDLLESTRRLARLPEAHRDALAQRCIARAREFDRDHFGTQLQLLLGIGPGSNRMGAAVS